MLFFILIPFINLVVLLVMIAFEIKRLGGCHLSSYKDKKLLILMILAFMQLREYTAFYLTLSFDVLTQLSSATMPLRLK